MSVKQNFPTIKPTLNLDFAGSQVVDSRITFTRASAATLTDAQGILRTVRDNKPRIDFDPSTNECKGLLIEEQRTNIVTHLNSYGAVSYLNCFGVPYSTLAPDGTYSGLLVQAIPNPTSVTCAFIAAYAGVSAGQVYACSIYLKAGTNPGTSIFALYDPPTSINYGNTNIFWSNGVPTVTNGATVTNAGNGWYRVTVLATIPSGQTDIIALLYPTGGEANKNVYCWNPQFELGSFSTSYISTASKFISRASSATYYDSTGVLRIAGTNQARNGFVYDTTTAKWISQGLILEPAATNILGGSNLYGNTLDAENIYTVTDNSADVIAPDGSSLTTKVVSGSTGNTWFWRIPSGGTFATNTTYTISVWLRSAAGTTGNWYLQPYPYDGATLCNITDQWKRFSVTFKTDGSGTQPYVGFVSPTLNRTFYTWGWQAELGSVATSYIPTVSSATTRAADIYSTGTATRASDNASMIGTNFNSWWNNSAHTVYAEAQTFKAGNDYMIAECANDNTTIVEMSLTFAGSAANKIQYINRLIASNNDIRSVPSYSANSFIKMSGSGSNSTTIGSASNTTSTVGASQTLSLNANQLYIGSRKGGSLYLNGHIKKLTFFGKALSQTEINGITA
jgi:hypothetical protein